MNWEDEGFVISKRKFRENAIILEVFTSKFGRVSGIVYGGNSRKIRNFLQLINKIFVVYNSKGDNKIYRGNSNIKKIKKTRSIIRTVFYRGAEHQISK